MGKKAVVFMNGDVLLFKAVMDNRLAWFIEKHSVNVSKKVSSPAADSSAKLLRRTQSCCPSCIRRRA